MATLRSLTSALYEKVLIAIGVLLVLLPVSPLNVVQPLRDSGVFLYIGWRMLHGEVPYLDMWDHKPPLIFFINALGLLLGGGSIWGVWVLEFILLFFAALIGFVLIKRYLGPLPAVFGLALWLMSLVFLINGGNLTTEYTLVLQFALLWLAVEAEEKGYFLWRGFLIGILAALAFFSKQNMVGISTAVLLYLIISRLGKGQYISLLRALLVILLGALTVIFLLLLYFVLTGSFTAFWDAAFTYNFLYINETAANRLEGILTGIRLLSTTGLVQLAFVGWAAGLTLLLFNRKIKAAYLPPLAIALLALPLELVLVGISGRGYKHYYMPLLPVLTVFASFTFWFIITSISTIPKGKKAGILVTMVALITLLFAPAAEYVELARSYNNESDALPVERIRSYTAESDTVLLWGNEAGYNFTARRASPSRFIYQYPLYTTGYADQQMIEAFLADIISEKPKLLIDTRNENTPLYQFGVTSPAIEEAIATLRDHYTFREGIGTWTVYEYVENP